MSSFGYNCHFGKILQVMKKALFNKILIGFKNRIRHTVVNGTIYTLKNTLVVSAGQALAKEFKPTAEGDRRAVNVRVW